MNEAIRLVESKHIKSDVPHIDIGDTVRVKIRVTERDRNNKINTRIQTFEGLVISRHGSGISEAITVRRVTYGIGVERVFPLHSPIVEGIEIARRGKVRRAKLYYLRDRVGKRARLRERTRHRKAPAPRNGSVAPVEEAVEPAAQAPAEAAAPSEQAAE